MYGCSDIQKPKEFSRATRIRNMEKSAKSKTTQIPQILGNQNERRIYPLS